MDKAFTELVTQDHAPVLERVEPLKRFEMSQNASFVVRPPYRLPSRSDFSVAPVQMLYWEYGLVPFLGRADVISEMEQWCDATEPLAVRLLIGEGGSGKSRLAAEMCVRLMAVGWDTGVVDVLHPAGIAAADLEDDSVLVVDDAEAHGDLIADLVSYLARGAGPRTRIVLIARQLGGWWDQLRAASPDVAWLTATRESISTVEGLSAEEREYQFGRAAQVFADRLRMPTPTDSTWPLDDPTFHTPLLVHMNALVAVLAEEPLNAESRLATRHQVLEQLLLGEKKRWQWTSAARALGDLRPEVRDRAVSVAILAGARTEREATEALRAIPDLVDANAERLGQVAGWLKDLYPGNRYLNALRPDLLAAEHLAQTLPEAPDLVNALFGLIRDADRSRELIGRLSRAAQDDSRLAPVVDQFAESNLAGICERWEELVRADRQDEAAELLSELDWGHLIWRGKAEMVRKMRERLVGTVTDPRQLAFQELSIGNICRVIGPHEEAITHLTEACNLFHALGDARMQAQSEADLGESLRTYGLHEEARSHLETARHLFRTLGQISDEAYCFAQLALTSSYGGEPSKAVTFANEGLARLAGVSEGEAVHVAALLHDGAALANFLLGDFERARQEIADAAEGYAKEGRLDDQGYVVNVSGMIHLLEGDRVAAQNDFRRAESLAKQMNYARLQGLAVFNQAHVALLDGQIDLAEELARRALSYFDALGSPERKPTEELVNALRLLRAGDHGGFESAMIECAARSQGMPDIHSSRKTLDLLSQG